MSGVPDPGNLGFGTWQVPSTGMAVPIAGLASLVVAGQVLPMISKGTAGWSKTTRSRIRDTYLYFGASCVAWMLSAVLAWKTGLVPSHPLGMVAIFLGTMYAMWKTQTLDYETQRASKSGWFLSFAALQGVVLSGLVRHLAQHQLLHLAVQALALTGAEAVAIAAVVAASPSGAFLWLAAPLSMGLGLLFGANLINYLFGGLMGGASSVLHRAEAYFGALLFSGYLLVDTAKLVRAAQTPPTQAVEGRRGFDAIKHALQLYLDAVNLFLYILRILLDQEVSSHDSSSRRRGSTPPLRSARRTTVHDLV